MPFVLENKDASVSGDGTGPFYQWQMLTENGWVNYEGETLNSLNMDSGLNQSTYIRTEVSCFYNNGGMSYNVIEHTDSVFIQVLDSCICPGIPNPGTISFLGSANNMICSETTFNLQATGVTNPNLPGIILQWQFKPTSSGSTAWENIPEGNEVLLEIENGITQSTDYRLQVTCTNGNETTTSSVLTVGINDEDLNIGNDVSFCAGESVTLYSNNSDPTAILLWSNGATSSNLVVSETGIYSVTITYESGCSVHSNSVAVTVIEDVPPSVNLGSNMSLCTGQSITLSSGNSDPNISVLWSTGATTNDIVVTEPNNYSVTLTHESSCSSTSNTVSIQFHEGEVPEIDLGGDIQAC